MSDYGRLEENVIKLTVRLKSLQEGKQLDTLVQIMDDLRCLADAQHCGELPMRQLKDFTFTLFCLNT